METAVTTTERGGEVAAFKPEEALERDAKTDAVIDFAKKVRDWPALEAAIDAKLEDQTEFVRWWGETVTARQSPGPAGNQSRADQRTIKMEDAEAQTGISHQQVSKWRNRLKDAEKYRAMLFGTAYHKAMAEVGNVRGTQGTGDNEWYTPAEYIELAREVMGGIDLDPATSAAAQETVHAEKWFDEKTNGLAQEWHGRVWLNPPYAQPFIAEFANKMAMEFSAGRVSEAVMLTHNYTDTAWFHEIASAASAICFTRGRIRFVRDDGEVAASRLRGRLSFILARAFLFWLAFPRYRFRRHAILG